MISAQGISAQSAESGPGAPAARGRAVRWAAVVLALVTAACTAACAGPPDKGEVRGAALNQSRNNVVILAREPTADMDPVHLVANFLQALTGDQEDPSFSVAQEFLTTGARSRWFPPGKTTWSTTTKIVDYSGPSVDDQAPADKGVHPDTDVATSGQPASAPAVGAVKTVTLHGTELAEVDPYGFFQYQSEAVTQQFTVKYLGAQTGWRIDTPPDFRIIKPDAFKRAYQTYQSPLPVYLPSHGAATPQMDQVYLTQATGKVDYTYDALARAVLHGRYRSQNTGLDLQSPVTVDPTGLATVVLKSAPTGALNITDVQHAMALTFRDAAQTQQLLTPTPVTEVRVSYPGCTTACTASSFIPEGTPGPTVYWVCPQGQAGDAIVSRQLPSPTDTPAVCPVNGGKVQPVAPSMAGLRLRKNSPIAVKQTPDASDVKAPAAPTVVAAVADDGKVIVLSDKNTDQRVWYTAQDASKVTDLEWDPVDGSLWVVDDGGLHHVQDPGDKGTADDSQDSVVAPVGRVSRFKPSPDGLRAVVVSQQSTSPAAQGGAQPTAMVTIDRSSGTPILSTDTVFQLLVGPSQSGDQQTPALQSVTDASWADGRTVALLGLVGGSSTPKLYKVYLDGSQDSTILDPEDAQPAAMHVTAVLTGSVGHPALWAFSDAPGPTDPTTTNSYFKRSGGQDSFQELGWSPVVATTAD